MLLVGGNKSQRKTRAAGASGSYLDHIQDVDVQDVNIQDVLTLPGRNTPHLPYN